MPRVHADTLKLIDVATNDTLTITPALSNGRRIFLESFDTGFPTVREDMADRPLDDGVDDYTEFYGPRAVSITVKVINGSTSYAETLAELAGWMSPRKRIKLVFTEEGLPERYMLLRGSNFTAPAERAELRTGHQLVQLQWVCASGKILSSTAATVFIPRDTGGENGREYPLTYPRDYPDREGIGAQIITLAGTESTKPIIRIHGPATGVEINNETTGRRLAFKSSMTLLNGQYVELDMENRTAQLNGIPGPDTSMRNLISAYDWWALEAGENIIRYLAVTGGPPTQAELIYHAAWLR